MTTWGLDSSAGYIAPRTSDWRTELRTAIDNAFTEDGLPLIDWTYDVAMAIFVDVIAAQLGALSDASQAIYDAQIPSSATGLFLDDLGALRGVTRLSASYSTTTATLYGTTGTVIPQGKIARDEDGVRWVTSEAGTVGDVIGFIAEETGATTLASGSTLTPITPVSGWTNAITATTAAPGRDRESDQDYRARQALALGNRGSLSANAIRGRMLTLSYITGCYVAVNDTGSSVTTGGLTLAAHSYTVVLYPSTLTDAQKEEVAGIIYKYGPVGIYTNGSASATVTREDGYTQTVRWAYASTLAVTVVATVTLKSGYVLADVQSAIQTLISDWFTDNASLGEAVTDSQIEAEIMNEIPGISRVVVTLNGSTTVTPDSDEIPTLSGTATVST